MKTIEINGSTRAETGKKYAKVYRKSGKVPAVIYGGDVNIPIAIVTTDLKPIVYTPIVHIVNIVVDGKTYKTILKDIQFHPVSDEILHIDFLQIFDDKKVTIALPVVLTGLSEAAKQGGKVMLITRKIRACGFPNELPETLEVDTTNLGLGKTIMLGDLNFDKIQLVDLKTIVIASAQLTRAAKGTQAADAAATPAAAAAAVK